MQKKKKKRKVFLGRIWLCCCQSCRVWSHFGDIAEHSASNINRTFQSHELCSNICQIFFRTYITKISHLYSALFKLKVTSILGKKAHRGSLWSFSKITIGVWSLTHPGAHHLGHTSFQMLPGECPSCLFSCWCSFGDKGRKATTIEPDKTMVVSISLTWKQQMNRTFLLSGNKHLQPNHLLTLALNVHVAIGGWHLLLFLLFEGGNLDVELQPLPCLRLSHPVIVSESKTLLTLAFAQAGPEEGRKNHKQCIIGKCLLSLAKLPFLSPPHHNHFIRPVAQSLWFPQATHPRHHKPS